VFHVELRRFPHVARTFNLSDEELERRVLAPWLAGQPLELEDRQWEPGRTKLTIYEARALAREEIGMGRGWGTVSRDGEDVTARLLASRRQPSELHELKDEILTRVREQRLRLGDVVELSDATRRPSERLSLAEQAVWELLHEARVRLIEAGTAVGQDRWQAVLLDWRAWTDDGISLSV